jgi:hypothetical protein
MTTRPLEAVIDDAAGRSNATKKPGATPFNKCCGVNQKSPAQMPGFFTARMDLPRDGRPQPTNLFDF